MNLAKNGAVLLAALSVFAMTSCKNDQGKTITFEQAKEWLDERCPEETTKKKVKAATLDWDYSKSTGESLLKEGLPRLVSYAIAQQKSDFLKPIEGTDAKKTTDFKHTYEESGPGSIGIKQSDGAKLEKSIKDAEDPDGLPSKCVIKNKKLYVTYDRVEELPCDGGTCKMTLEQTDVYSEDCYTYEFTLKLPNEEVNYAGLTTPDGNVPAFSGVTKGYVHCVFSEFFTE